MLVTLTVMGVMGHGFNSQWLAHEVEHAREALVASADHIHDTHAAARVNVNIDAGTATEPISDADHKLLHALVYFDPRPASTLSGLSALAVQSVPPPLLNMPPAELESPFRPPRVA